METSLYTPFIWIKEIMVISKQPCCDPMNGRMDSEDELTASQFRKKWKRQVAVV